MIEGQGICISGMHRSGTSLTARVVNLLGVDLGPSSEMLEPVESHNPRGYWEQRAIMDLNDRLLAAFGGWWLDPPTFPSEWQDSPEIKPLREEARALLERYFGKASLWAWKDPRNSLTLPFWRALVPNLWHIVCVRDLQDCAASMHASPIDLSLEECIVLSREYNAAAFRHTDGQRRLIVDFDDYFADAETEIRRLAAFVGVDFDSLDEGVRDALLTEIVPTLRHHGAG